MSESFEPIKANFPEGMVDFSADLYLGRRKKILVVDDDQDFRLSVCEILVDEGYSVMSARDGESALNHLVCDNDLPDLILVDLIMPVKGGLEFRREQLKLNKIASIPVMFVTGQGYVEGERCILKPFDVRDFIEKIKNSIS